MWLFQKTDKLIIQLSIIRLLVVQEGIAELRRRRQNQLDLNGVKTCGPVTLLGKDFMSTLTCKYDNIRVRILKSFNFKFSKFNLNLVEGFPGYLNSQGIIDVDFVSITLGGILFDDRRKLNKRRNPAETV